MAIFLDFPALVDLSVPERDQVLETRPCVAQFASLDGQLAQRLHHLVTGRGHVLHDQQTTRRVAHSSSELVVPTIDELIDRVRALEAELERERRHRHAAESHADALETLIRHLDLPQWDGIERRSGVSLANWQGIDRRKA